MKIKWWLFAFLACLLAAVLSPLASSAPDGLEQVAEDKGFLLQGKAAPFKVMADYLFPGIENETLATVLAGVTGTVLLFGLAYGVAWLLRARKGKA